MSWNWSAVRTLLKYSDVFAACFMFIYAHIILLWVQSLILYRFFFFSGLETKTCPIAIDVQTVHGDLLLMSSNRMHWNHWLIFEMRILILFFSIKIMREKLKGERDSYERLRIGIHIMLCSLISYSFVLFFCHSLLLTIACCRIVGVSQNKRIPLRRFDWVWKYIVGSNDGEYEKIVKLNDAYVSWILRTRATYIEYIPARISTI